MLFVERVVDVFFFMKVFCKVLIVMVLKCRFGFFNVIWGIVFVYSFDWLRLLLRNVIDSLVYLIK